MATINQIKVNGTNYDIAVAGGNVSGAVASATTATKIGSSTVGSATQPVYINAGTPTVCTYTLGKSVPSNAVFTDTDTHYTTGIRAGASGTNANSAATNGNVYLKVLDNTTYRGQVKIVGSGATTVTSDANGVITISSTDTNTNTTYSNMTGATASAAGKAGLVPAPAAGKQTSFLRGDGKWVVPTNTTYSAATQSANGLMSAADKKKLDGIATGANNYTYTLPAATSSVLGGVKTSTGITNSSGTISVAYGTAAGTACQGNDSRLSNARTPVAHTSTTASTYGQANAQYYGHVKISDNYLGSSGNAASGVAASSYAVNQAYNALNHYVSWMYECKSLPQTIPSSVNFWHLGDWVFNKFNGQTSKACNAFVVPEGYRPTTLVWSPVIIGGPNNTWWAGIFKIYPTGSIEVYAIDGSGAVYPQDNNDWLVFGMVMYPIR